MIDAMIGPSATPVRRREPSMPNCGPGWAAKSGVRWKSSTRMPVKPRAANRPPVVTVSSAAMSPPMLSGEKAMVARARRTGPAPSGSEGWGRGSSRVTSSTRAAWRARRASVSPGRSVKVPVDWSAAIFSAMARGSPGVSSR